MGEYLSTHNSSLEISSNGVSLVRSKINLVPFEEFIPYGDLFDWIRKITGTLGGFTFSPLYQGSQHVVKGNVKATPLICYEILFGEEVARHSLSSNIFFLQLNEGWYENVTGSLQFLYYTSIRAVESRRAIARSSNMGFLALVNQRGDIVKKSDSINRPTSIAGVLTANDDFTFYAEYGDFIGQICIGIIIVLFLLEGCVLINTIASRGKKQRS